MELDQRSSDLQYSFLKERISNIDKHFSEISLKLAAYLKKLAQVRDSGDDLAGSISSFAATENLNLSLRKGLIQFADILKAVQEYRDAEIQRTDVKVVLMLADYKPICKKAKNEIKISVDILAKELSMKNQLEKTRRKNPTNRKKIAQTEKEAYRLQKEATRTTLELSKRMDNFEQQKLLDIKHTFLEFMKIELLFHAKAIELYTEAYNSIKNIKVDEDLYEFRSHFRSFATPLDPDTTLQAGDQTNIDNNESVHPNSDAGNTMEDSAMSNTGFQAPLDSGTLLHVATIPKKIQSAQKKGTLNEPNNSALKNVSSCFGDFLTA